MSITDKSYSGNKYKPPVRRDREPQWVAVMPRPRDAKHGAGRPGPEPLTPNRVSPWTVWLVTERIRATTHREQHSRRRSSGSASPPRPLTSRKEHRNARRPVDLGDTRDPRPS